MHIDNMPQAEDNYDWMQGLDSLFGMNFSSQENATYNKSTYLRMLEEELPKQSLAKAPAQLIAITVSLIAILVNITSLLAVSKVKGLLTTNQRLIVSLCLSDILVSSCVLLDNLDVDLMSGSDCVVCLIVIRRSMKMTSHIITLMNLLGLAMDHYMAIAYTLRYMSMMTTRRTNCMIVILWLLASVVGFSDFFFPFFQFSYCSNPNETKTYCDEVWCAAYNSEYLVIALAFILLVAMIYLYIRICIHINNSQSFDGRHQRAQRKTRKGLVTTAIIVGSFILCWLPYSTFQVVITLQVLTNFAGNMEYFGLVLKLDLYLYDLLLMNCLIDPVIYAIRMREVRRGYRRWFDIILKRKQQPKLTVRFGKKGQSETMISENGWNYGTPPLLRVKSVRKSVKKESVVWKDRVIMTTDYTYTKICKETVL